MNKIVLRVLCGVFALGMLVSGFFIVKDLIDTSKTEKFYENLQEEFTKPIPPIIPQQTVGGGAITDKNALDIAVDFSTLKNKNSDIVGWLYLPNTVLNYPVVQADDNDKYLRRDLDGKKLTAGTLFADFRCGTAGSDTNYIIYGHNMRNGTMFKTVTDYKKQSFYDEHPVIYYLTQDKSYKIEPILGLIIPDDDELYSLGFDNAKMLSYIESKKWDSSFTSPTTYSAEDKFITLSTCSKEYDNARFVLIGKISEVE